MKSFSQLNIKTTQKGFEGDKIKISRILDKEIIVHAFRLEDSKVFKDRGTCKCLHLQISLDGDKHVVFTSSSGLIEAICQVNEADFPFMTTIRRENDRFLFT
jgi:hypothetical protein